MGDEEPSWEVERILYQKDIRDERGKLTTRYLVKWLNFHEEECTWEPEESFDGDIVFAEWQNQWKAGDVLEKDDLQRVEDQMKAFQLRQNVPVSISESDADAEYQTASESTPPPTRLRLVSNEL